jgi:hypothetical protein
MTDEILQPRPNRRIGLKVALVGAGLAAGAIGATAIGANAQTSSPQTANGTAAVAEAAPSGAPSDSTHRPANAHGAAPVRSDEKAVSADVAAKLKAAALKAVPGGTVYRVETDAGDATYEAHMTKADGTEVTVKFDKSYKVTAVESGMGKGDPGGPGK